MTLPQQHYSGLPADDVKGIVKLCNCTVQTFEIIGNVFVNSYSKRYNVLSLGSALVVTFGEFNGRTKLRQRIVLLYLIYKVNDLDVSPILASKRTREENLANLQYHPFSAFLISLMGNENVLGSSDCSFNSSFPAAVLSPQERYLLGLLLTGRCDEILKRTPVDIAQMVIHREEVFDLRWLVAAVKAQQAGYSNLSKASIPAFLRVSDEAKSSEGADDLEASLIELLGSRHISDIFPPPFYRFVPTLMPPSDDEFQFLYPFLLEPLWMDAETLKGDAGSESAAKASNFDNSMGKNKTADADVLNVLPALNTELGSLSIAERKAGSSLPNSPKTSVSLASDDALRASRAASVCSLPPNFISPMASEKKLSEDSIASKESPFLAVSLSDNDKLPREDAVSLMSKALRGVIARHDAQRLGDAIVNDPTIVESVEIPINYFPKLINDNPAVAAAVILERIKKNAGELPMFFEMLTRMNFCVQGMEVVNKLCSQVEFPQEYLNRFISSCVQRCEDPSLTSAALCRQPLSVELQSFALKYSNVREAASLYQAILIAMQSEIPKNDSEIHLAMKPI